MIRRYVAFAVLRWSLRLGWRLLKAAVTAGIMVAAAPVSLVAGYGVLLAWLLGWPPRRLYAGALWCLPMAAGWLAWTGLRARSSGVVVTVASAPYHAWLSMWHLAAVGSVAAAAVTIAPAAIPLGLLAGGLAWSYRIYSMQTGTGGLTPSAPVVFDVRQWRRQVRSARARIAAPGAVPLTAKGCVLPGAVIRAVGHPQRSVAMLPYARLRSHQVVIGTTGTGKTTLLLRLWAGFMAIALQRYAAGSGRRPLLVVLDCKGGADSRRVADRARRVLRAAGARSTAIWPDEASLSIWALPPEQLITTLLDLVEHGTGSAAYYTDVMDTVVSLAVGAPPGPPSSVAGFLERLDPEWLATAYGAGGHESELGLLRSAAGQVADVALRFRALFRRLGPGLDGPGTLADADVWYCILEGTAEVSVAEAQARALVDLLASYMTSGAGRAGVDALLAVDEFSAVSRRLPVWQLYERARSLGLAVQVSAQSWQGLATGEDERYRVAASADGGIWVLRTPHPEPLVALAGTRRIIDTARRVAGTALWMDDGSSRVRHVPKLDGDIVRALGAGQAGYVYRGGVTFIQVKRLVAGPAALAAPPRVPVGHAPEHDGARPEADGPVVATLPDAGPLLDEAFGKEPR
jgi:hypothetical protein